MPPKPETRNLKPTGILLLFLLSITGSYAQTWENVGNGPAASVYDLAGVNNRLYACGQFGVKYWNDSNWTILPFPGGLTTMGKMAVHDDTLYIWGNVADESAVYKLRDDAWVPVGGYLAHTNWSRINQLVSFNGQLIAAGLFSSIDGVAVSNIAAWDGTSWSSVGNGLNDLVYCMAVYKDELYALGSFTASGTDSTVRGFAKWNGTNWSRVDQQLTYSPDGPMVPFKDDLIIANMWDLFGQPMKGAAKWTGSGFVSIGEDHLLYLIHLHVFNDELYAAAQIQGIPPNGFQNSVLKWTGSLWQVVGGPFNAPITALADYNNELIAGGSFTLNGTKGVVFIARFNTQTGMSEPGTAPHFTVYPNPAAGQFVFETTETGTLSIHNQLGQLLKVVAVENASTLVKTDDLEAGVYFLRFRTEKGNMSKTLVVY